MMVLLPAATPLRCFLKRARMGHGNVYGLLILRNRGSRITGGFRGLLLLGVI